MVRQVQLRQMDPIWAHQFRHDFLVPKIDFMFGQVGQVFPMPGVVEECRKSAVAARDRALREFAEPIPDVAETPSFDLSERDRQIDEEARDER